MIFKTVRVAETQRVLWFRDGNFQGVLTPGVYRFWKRLKHTSFESFDVADVEAVLPNARYLVDTHGDLLNEHLSFEVLGAQDVALVTVNGQGHRMAMPGEVVSFWRGGEGRVEKLNAATTLEVPKAWLEKINRGTLRLRMLSKKAITRVNVDEGVEAVVLVDGEVERVLTAGRYAFFQLGRDVKAVQIDRRVQELEVNGQEILTRDRVSLRANAALQYSVVDTLRATVEFPEVASLAYKAMQFALRRAIGALTLDELLTDKNALVEAVTEDTTAALTKLGLAVASVGVKDFILPGEMKDILNRVVEAEKVAEANAIRRRDESQNVRALANTARQLDGNPMMARLKELEALQNVTSSVNTLNVYSGLDGVMGDLVKLDKS